MEPHERALDEHGIDYKPITFSAYGRPSQDSLLFIKTVARRKARRKGTEKHLEERFIKHKVTHEIWRRAGRIIRRCLTVSADEVANEDDQFKESTSNWRRGREDCQNAAASDAVAAGGG